MKPKWSLHHPLKIEWITPTPQLKIKIKWIRIKKIQPFGGENSKLLGSKHDSSDDYHVLVRLFNED